MPPADSRRINPVTQPTDARIEPDWEACLRQMVTFQPDIVQQQLLTRVAELQLLSSRNQLLPVLNVNALYQLNGLGHHLDNAEAVMTGRTITAINPMLQAQQRLAGLNPSASTVGGFNFWQVGLTFQMPIGYRGPLANAKSAQYTLLRQRAFTQQTVHQTTHALYRFFIEVDSNYKLFKTATNLKKAALVRLEAQRAYYENGSITIDRYLEALRNWSNAVAQEADFRTRYNTAIAALEESKGTLLAYNNIALAEGPWPRKAYIQAREYQQPAHSQHPVAGNGPTTRTRAARRRCQTRRLPHPPEGFRTADHQAALAAARWAARPTARLRRPATAPGWRARVLVERWTSTLVSRTQRPARRGQLRRGPEPARRESAAVAQGQCPAGPGAPAVAAGMRSRPIPIQQPTRPSSTGGRPRSRRTRDTAPVRGAGVATSSAALTHPRRFPPSTADDVPRPPPRVPIPREKSGGSKRPTVG